MPCRTHKTAHTAFCSADDGYLLSVNPGAPARQALSEAIHLLDSLNDELARACVGEPISDKRAYLLLTIADQVRALVVSCAEGTAE